MRRKSTPVKIAGRQTSGLRRLDNGQFQVQFEGLPYSDVYFARTDVEAADFLDQYVEQQKAFNQHGDLRVMSLLKDWFCNYGRDGTAISYWGALQAGGDRPGNRTDKPPTPGGFIDTFGDRWLQTITSEEYAEFFQRATLVNGDDMSTPAKRKLRDAIKKLYWQANREMPKRGKLSATDVLGAQVVKDAIEDDTEAMTETLGMAPAMSLEELGAAAAGTDSKALNVEELRAVLHEARSRPAIYWYMLITQLVFGLRVGELRALQKSDVALQHNLLQVRGSASRGKMGGVKDGPLKEYTQRSNQAGRAQKAKLKFIPTRMIPILQAALKGVAGYRRAAEAGAGSKLLFPGEDPSKHFCTTGYGRRCTEVLQDAGIRRVTATHWMRHTRITEGAAMGNINEQDPELLMRIGGHASMGTTRLYMHQDATLMALEAAQANEFLGKLLSPRLVPNPPQKLVAV